MNRKNRGQFMTYDKNTCYFNSTIISVEEKNKECSNGKFKNVFTCKHPNKENGITCILWQRSSLEAGDKIKMDGKFKDEVFIAYSAMVQKNGNIPNAT